MGVAWIPELSHGLEAELDPIDPLDLIVLRGVVDGMSPLAVFGAHVGFLDSECDDDRPFVATDRRRARPLRSGFSVRRIASGIRGVRRIAVPGMDGR